MYGKTVYDMKEGVVYRAELEDGTSVKRSFVKINGRLFNNANGNHESSDDFGGKYVGCAWVPQRVRFYETSELVNLENFPELANKKENEETFITMKRGIKYSDQSGVIYEMGENDVLKSYRDQKAAQFMGNLDLSVRLIEVAHDH